jgi:hypothetical protein
VFASAAQFGYTIAQHDPALIGPVVAGAAVHRRALVPHQEIAAPFMGEFAEFEARHQ